MTAQKSFKKRVRARMHKTGESYTTARRHLLQGDHPFEVPAPAHCHLPGSIPGATALRILLAHAGIHGPDDRPLSEAMTFGIAGGVGIGVFQFHYEKDDFFSFFLAGRHAWHDDLLYLRQALSAFDLPTAVNETSGGKAAEKSLRTMVADARPCVAWVDAAHLPHRAVPDTSMGGEYHIVTVYAIDDDQNIAWIGDCTDHPLQIGLKELAQARACIKKFKNRVLSLSEAPQTKCLDSESLKKLVCSGIRRCCEQLKVPALKSSGRNFQLEAIGRWADRLDGSTAKDGWESVFRPGANLWRALTSIYECVEHRGTGGGLCRPQMADFLEEASRLPGLERLASVAATYRTLGRGWSELARAALADDASEMRDARGLLDTRAELTHDAAPAEDIRAVWRELHSLAERARTEFPLSEDKCAALRAELKERALALHQGEVSALDQLEASLG